MTDTPKPFTADEITDLKAKAKAATPGPWFASGRAMVDQAVTVPHPQLGLVVLAKVPGIAKEHPHANATHIAAANPETILRLIDMVERRDAALNEIALAGENGLPPDYNSWLQFHERIARMAREALTTREPQPADATAERKGGE